MEEEIKKYYDKIIEYSKEKRSTGINFVEIYILPQNIA